MFPYQQVSDHNGLSSLHHHQDYKDLTFHDDAVNQKYNIKKQYFKFNIPLKSINLKFYVFN